MAMAKESTKPKKESAGFNIGMEIVLAYFFFVYAFQNPDPGSCFAKEGQQTGQSTAPVTRSGEGDAAVHTTNGGFVDVSAQFGTWFLLGFVLIMVGLSISVLACLY